MGMTKAIAERAFIAANVLTPHAVRVSAWQRRVARISHSAVPQADQKGWAGHRHGAPMTRFLMTLERDDTVFEAEHSAPGRSFPARRRSTSWTSHGRRAIAADRDQGHRSAAWRKEHEILVSEEECRHTFQHGDYYVIAPMLPELRRHRTQSDPPLNRA
jgi:UDP-glucose 4-epimerase